MENAANEDPQHDPPPPLPWESCSLYGLEGFKPPNTYGLREGTRIEPLTNLGAHIACLATGPVSTL